MALKFVAYDPDKQNDEHAAKEKTEIRSHASSRGYRNWKRAKAAQLGNVNAGAQTSMVSPVQAALNALMPAKVRIRVTLKNTRPFNSSLSRHSSSSSRSNTSPDSSASEVEVPSPERQISAELNTPRYLYMWTQQLFPGFQEFTKCFNIHDVQAISVIRPYLDQEVFKSTLASLSYGLASFYVGTEITTSKEMLLHRGKAITLLRSHLDAGQAHSAVLLSILYMIMLEMLLDNTEAADTHKEILRHLIRRHGGLEALDEHVISVILQQNQYWIDIGVQPILESVPITTALEYPSSEILATIQDAIVHLPPGFRQIVNKGEIATCNLEFLFRITDFHRDRHKRGSAFQSSQSVIDSDSSSASPSQRYRSLQDALPVLAMPESDSIIFQKFLGLALVIHSTIYLNKPATFMHYLIQARAELTAKLPTLSKHITPFYHQEQCLFWIWYTAVTSWESSPDGAKLENAQKERFKAFYGTQQTDMILKNFSWDANMI